MTMVTDPTLDDDRWGLFVFYKHKFFFEENDYDVSEFFFYPYGQEIRRPNTIELVKRFLKQVRESRGYDVDCYPPLRLESPFIPLQLEELRQSKRDIDQRCYAIIVKAAECAIQKIIEETQGDHYKLVKIERAVFTRILVMFLTLTVKDVGPVQTVQAAVYCPIGKDPVVHEWRFKPLRATSDDMLSATSDDTLKNDYDVSESYFYLPGEEIRPNTIELVKRFLKQVRESRGYDVDCCPPTSLDTPFIPLQLEELRQSKRDIDQRCYANIGEAAECAIQKIIEETGNHYKLVKIERAVLTRILVMFLTLTVKDVGPVETVQAAVYCPIGDYPVVHEWRWGLFVPYKRKFFFEENDYDVSEYYFYLPGEEIRPNTIELVKRFLKQVRESRGYDVDCYPPLRLESPFMPLQLEELRQSKRDIDQRCYANIVEAAESAIQKIIEETQGDHYKLVKIEKAVLTRILLMFLTLTVKDVGPVQTVQAAVYCPIGKVPVVHEWRFKPLPATSDDMLID
ncbi:ATPase associated with various cellularactivities [Striga asiatica]|uniref:ATPase associated with various cellularactivities n=1 Tax=Striga asiatica TaxID=4170 RepID=A0A5A7R3H4_STRAF|nr:ATPase associated with various cellularactivities [Striga asiatica]